MTIDEYLQSIHKRYCILSFEAIRHYQKIIGTLMETDRLIQEIDGVGLEY